MRRSDAERRQLARRRLFSVLNRHVVANSRTLEQKISDAGPFDQRIDPHILTEVRNVLIREGRILRKMQDQVPWFYLPNTPEQAVSERLDEQLQIVRQMQGGDLSYRIGQCLEIATYKTLLLQERLDYFGSFRDLDEHDDSTLYSKEEPPQSFSGNRLDGAERLDFLVGHPSAGWAGVEVKNVREWLYPDRTEITDLIRKAVTLDCVPILIARRFPFVTFRLLSTCGVLLHETYNQRYPESARQLAEKAKDKRLLGYHDIRVGNEPDSRLKKFISVNLPRILPKTRDRFDAYKDLLEAFGVGDMTYKEFAARVRRRSQGKHEDSDWDENELFDA